MKKFLVFLVAGVVLSLNIYAQQGQGQGQPPRHTPEERAKMTVDEVAKTVTMTAKQKTDMTTIFTTFYNDVREKHAFRDPAAMAPLEKDRDAKVEKLLNNKASYKKYQDAMAELKKRMEQQRQQGGPHN
jgi:hypothetical protein